MSRIYCVDHNGIKHMVMANNKHQAINHIAKRGYSATVATQPDLVAWLQDGRAIETANAATSTNEPGESNGQSE